MDRLGIFHANQKVCVLIHIRINGEVGTMKLVWVLQSFLLTIPGRCFFY